ncbi:hypothetical protein [Oceanobacillus jeddahense]|uniref:HIRAN domain-containing protein n=1 Tax=Oceanobacillus jeddahense TaxID=1462527 RepID=A0ABY5JU91_9BACI|nr:hypothetical protein [Oceanobacillus jeddahense]UUI02738.1 hypothetical protein NP439_22315 [Oceanobacillus jeddahense]
MLTIHVVTIGCSGESCYFRQTHQNVISFIRCRILPQRNGWPERSYTQITNSKMAGYVPKSKYSNEEHDNPEIARYIYFFLGAKVELV